jgi:hypothetical protein
VIVYHPTICKRFLLVLFTFVSPSIGAFHFEKCSTDFDYVEYWILHFELLSKFSFGSYLQSTTGPWVYMYFGSN